MASVRKGKKNREGTQCSVPPSLLLFVSAFFFVNQGGVRRMRFVVESLTTDKNDTSCYPKIGLRPLRDRKELPGLLEEHNLKTGIEIGVQKGNFAKTMLDGWKSCEKYHLVDPWKHQANYTANGNVSHKQHQEFYEKAKEKVEKHKGKVEFHRMLSVEAAKKFDDESIDFVYVDARHDYCGVKDDLEHYWPIVKPGGIMAGHDYNQNSEIAQDWGLCADGTRNEMAVKGAVNDFFVPKGLTISVTYYRERNYMTWMVQKPLC